MPRNRPEHINTFTGGMNKEAANSMVAASQYRHAENLRITTTDGEGNGVLIKDINKKNLEYSLVDLISNSNKRTKLQRKAWDNFKFSAKRSSEKLDFYRDIILSREFVDD